MQVWRAAVRICIATFNGATAAVVAMALGVLAGGSAPKKLKAGDGF